MMYILHTSGGFLKRGMWKQKGPFKFTEKQIGGGFNVYRWGECWKLDLARNILYILKMAVSFLKASTGLMTSVHFYSYTIL